MDSRFRGNDRTGVKLVIFGLDPEIQEREVLVILWVPAFWIPAFAGMTKYRCFQHFGLCATLTRSLRSGPPVGVAFGPPLSRE